jgi:hypothetical protein
MKIRQKYFTFSDALSYYSFIAISKKPLNLKSTGILSGFMKIITVEVFNYDNEYSIDYKRKILIGGFSDP